MANSYHPGDVIVTTLNLLASGGSYNMILNYQMIEIFESIFTPNVVASVTVLDSIDVINSLNLIGSEPVTISFYVPGLPTLTYNLVLESIELEPFLGSEKAKQIKFHLVGQETLVDKSLYIQKSYNTDIASIISDIHKTFLKSSSPLKTEATQGQQNIIIPNYKPFEAIDMVRQRATSATNQSSTYVYFQNASGHQFVTIEGMMKGGSVKNFIHADALPTSIYNNTLNNIIDYEVPKFFSAVNRIDLGGIVQRTATYDVRTRSYNYKDQTMGNNGLLSNFFSKFANGFNVFSFLPFDSASRGNTYLPQTTPLQMNYLSQLMQSSIILKVYGDPTVQAGNVINAQIPQSVTTTNIQMDPLLSRNYLVSRIARYIGNVTTFPRYTETIEGIFTNS